MQVSASQQDTYRDVRKHAPGTSVSRVSNQPNLHQTIIVQKRYMPKPNFKTHADNRDLANVYILTQTQMFVKVQMALV